MLFLSLALSLRLSLSVLVLSPFVRALSPLVLVVLTCHSALSCSSLLVSFHLTLGGVMRGGELLVLS